MITRLRMPVAMLLASTSLFSVMVSADPFHDALTECKKQQNDLKRLVCYDEIKVAELSGAAAATNMPVTTNRAVQAHSQAPVRPVPSPENEPAIKATSAEQDFGLEQQKIAKEQADQLYMTVSNINYSPRKELIVEFENGQIWRQTSSDYYPLEVGERHYIKRGLFNSFRLGNDENNRSVKVRRVE